MWRSVQMDPPLGSRPLLLLGFGQQKNSRSCTLPTVAEASLLYLPPAALASVSETPRIPATRRRTAVHGSHRAEPSRRPHPRWLMRGPICGQRDKVRERRERGKMSWEEEEGLTRGEGVRQRQIHRPAQAPAAPPSSPLLASLSPYLRLCGSSLPHPRPHLLKRERPKCVKRERKAVRPAVAPRSNNAEKKHLRNTSEQVVPS
jgi:hypothetical protein